MKLGIQLRENQDQDRPSTISELIVECCSLNNSISKLVAQHLIDHIELVCLNTFIICNSWLGHYGVVAMMEMLGRSNNLDKMVEFEISVNTIEDRTIPIIANAIEKMTNLEYLSLDGNCITSSGIVQLLATTNLANLEYLEQITVACNDIGDDGLRAIGNMIPRCRNLNRIDISCNQFSKKAIADFFGNIQQYLRQFKTPKQFMLIDNTDTSVDSNTDTDTSVDSNTDTNNNIDVESIIIAMFRNEPKFELFSADINIYDKVRKAWDNGSADRKMTALFGCVSQLCGKVHILDYRAFVSVRSFLI